MNGSLVAKISTLQTTTFVMSDPRNFKFVGSILEVLSKKVLQDNSITNDYCKLPTYGVHPIPVELQKIIDEGDKPMRRGKRKAKATTSETVKTLKKPKKPIQKMRSTLPVIQEESKERTIT